MYCLNCQELIVKKITYKNIFKPNKHKICDKCFSKIIFIQELEVLPIDSGLIYLNILFDKKINEFSLMGFLKPYYLYYLKNMKDDSIILYFESYDEKVYELIKDVKLGNIYMMSLNRKREKL